MLRRALGLFLLANVVGVIVNLPSILAALDGRAIGETVGEWTIGVGVAAGDLVGEIAEGAPTPEEILAIQDRVRDGTLERPLDDANVAALVALWRALEAAGNAVDAAQIAELLADEGVDVDDLPSELLPSPAASDDGDLPLP